LDHPIVGDHVSKGGEKCADLANWDGKIVNNFDLIHWICDHLLAICSSER